MQAMYADNRAANGPKYYPSEFFPADPGLLFAGIGDGPVALFFGTNKRAPDGRIVVLTFQDTWAEFSADITTVLTSVIQGELDLWLIPGVKPTLAWSFDPDPPSDPDAIPPLLEAVLLGDANRVRALAQAGADMNQGGADGNTPLCRTDDEGMVRLLLELGADPNRANRAGYTPLTVACTSCVPVGGLRALLEAGADPNLPGSDGWPPLAWACQNKDAEEVELLLRFGADPNAVAGNGRTPLQIARKRAAILDLLRAAGAH